MIDHLGLAVGDIAAARAFYTAALAPLGYRLIRTERTELGHTALLFGTDEIDFIVADGERVGEGNHVAFRAASRAEVDAFHVAALSAGGRDNGAPGLRPRYAGRYYAAFVCDPDGTNVEAVFHEERA